jgi:UV DNA damage endonuclease
MTVPFPVGYACINTILRNKKPASESVFSSRTCRYFFPYPCLLVLSPIFLTRLDSLNKNGMGWVKELGRQNVRDLITMIQWNEDNVCASLYYVLHF